MTLHHAISLTTSTHSREVTNQIVAAIQSPKDCKTIIEHIKSEAPPVPQRLAWVLSVLADEKPEILQPNVEDLIQLISSEDYHDAIYRNGLKALAAIDITEDYQGILFDLCISKLGAEKEPVAIKVHAMQIAANICKEHPVLATELIEAIRFRLKEESGGYLSRARRLIPKLERLAEKAYQQS